MSVQYIYIYIYIYKQKEYKVVKDKEANKKKYKKNRCASMVVVVGSSNGLSSHPFASEQLQVPIASEVAHLPLP